MASSEGTDERDAGNPSDDGDGGRADEPGDERAEQDGKNRRGGGRSNGWVRPAVAMRNARDQLSDLLGREPESVSALNRTENGWLAQVEVLELARIPDSTSVLATYAVELDPDGELVGYERRRRYARGQIDRR